VVGQRISDNYPNAGRGTAQAPAGTTISPRTGTVQGEPYQVQGTPEPLPGQPTAKPAAQQSSSAKPVPFSQSLYFRGNEFTVDERQGISKTLNLGPGVVFDPSNGAHVKLLQQALKQGGYNLGSYGVDSRFGGNTLNAARQYLEKNKTTGTAVAGAPAPVTAGGMTQLQGKSAGTIPMQASPGLSDAALGAGRDMETALANQNYATQLAPKKKMKKSLMS
jgi:hypothetical protein